MTWQCLRSGECCERVARVVMTHAERRALEQRATEIGALRLQWRAAERPRFTALVARPCPFLAHDEGKAICRAHDVRPYNCRRFMCGRTDLSEPHDRGIVSGIPLRVLQSETLRQDYDENQRAAQVWADAHGWSA